MEAMSAGWPVRPSDDCLIKSFSKSEPMKPALTVPSVSTMPGLMELTRIFLGPSSRARTPVMASTAPLVAVYTEVLGDIAGDGDGFASGGGDGSDDFIRAGFAGGVVHDYRRAFGGKGLGDGGSD